VEGGGKEGLCRSGAERNSRAPGAFGGEGGREGGREGGKVEFYFHVTVITFNIF